MSQSNSSSQTVLRMNSRIFPPSRKQREIFAQAGIRMIEMEVFASGPLPEQAVQADAILVVSCHLSAEQIQQLKRCRILSRQGTGVDNIDVDQATRQGIIVTNVPNYATEEVADHTLALLLNAARRVKDLDAYIRTGHRPKGCPCLRRLSTQTLGLIGFGRIARAVAKRARAFGMRVLAYDPAMDESIADELGVEVVDKNTVLTESDFVSLHCPLTPQNHKLLGRGEFARMKPSAVLLNTARGELVDEDALAAALERKQIAYAAIDVLSVVNVFDEEGFPTNHKLFSLPNVLATPHISSLSCESLDDLEDRAARAVVDVLQGRLPAHPVNPDVTPWFEMDASKRP